MAVDDRNITLRFERLNEFVQRTIGADSTCGTEMNDGTNLMHWSSSAASIDEKRPRVSPSLAW